jgi:antitoxin PrlF
MPTATLTSKGQITLPQAVRRALGLEAGDKVDFVPEPGGGYRVLALRRDVRELRGMFAGRVARPVTVEEMDAAIEAEVAARNRSSVLRVAEPAPRKRSR